MLSLNGCNRVAGRDLPPDGHVPMQLDIAAGGDDRKLSRLANARAWRSQDIGLRYD